MTYQEDYIAFVNEITAKCKSAGISDDDIYAIVDLGVHQQDAHHDFGTDVYWDTMIYAATNMAALACEDLGCNLNDIMGRLVY